MITACLLALLVPLQALSQWFWQNPQPQGNSLTDVHFINAAEGWATTSLGTVIHTTDGGEHWEIQQTGTTATYSSVFFFDSMHGWICGTTNASWELIEKTTDGGQTWEKVYEVLGNFPLKDIFFADLYHGWAVGQQGRFLMTVDGGSTWMARYIQGTATVCLKSVWFRNTSEGWIAGTAGTILKSTDGGMNWQAVAAPYSQNLNCISFADDINGTIVGDDGTIFNTHDGGITWISYSTVVTQDLFNVSFSGSGNGLIFGRGILKSDDGGISWTVTKLYESLSSGSYPTITTAFGVGGNGRIIKSVDGGVTWSDLSSGTSTDLIRDAYFLDENRGWLLENGHIILHTENGGNDWTRIDTLPDYAEAFCFTGEINGWAASNAAIMRTSDGGFSWNIQLLNTGHTLRMCDITFIDDQHGWALGEDTVLRTVNGGETWIKHQVGCTGLRSIFFTDALTGFAAGHAGGIMKTTDGGITWSHRTTATLTDFEDIFFCDPMHGWAAGMAPGPSFQSVVARTTDSGETWQVIYPPFTQYLYEIAFADTVNGWISCSNGGILHTTDGGLTWERQNLLTDNFLYNIDFVDKFTGWATGGYGTILKTVHGGMVGEKPIDLPASSGLRTFPNPAPDQVTIAFEPEPGISSELILYNLSGAMIRRITTGHAGKGTREIIVDVSSLPEGFYWCRVNSGNRTLTAKIVVSR